jgi:hypothetical protein
MVRLGRWRRGPQWCWAPTGSQTQAAHARRALLSAIWLLSRHASMNAKSTGIRETPTVN